MQLTRDHIERMLHHAVAGLPNEACGILAGKAKRHCYSSTRETLIRVLRRIELTDDGYAVRSITLEDEGQFCWRRYCIPMARPTHRTGSPSGFCLYAT